MHFTTSAPNFLWRVGGCFQFFTKNRPQKHQKRAILHTSQANGGGGLEPPRPPGYATAHTAWHTCPTFPSILAFNQYRGLFFKRLVLLGTFKQVFVTPFGIFLFASVSFFATAPKNTQSLHQILLNCVFSEFFLNVDIFLLLMLLPNSRTRESTKLPSTHEKKNFGLQLPCFVKKQS